MLELEREAHCDESERGFCAVLTPRRGADGEAGGRVGRRALPPLRMCKWEAFGRNYSVLRRVAPLA